MDSAAEKLSTAAGDAAVQKEGITTKAIESQTAKIPSGFFLALGLGSIATSLGLQLAGKQKASNFVGIWVPTILIMGLYNKMVKLEGSDRFRQ